MRHGDTRSIRGLRSGPTDCRYLVPSVTMATSRRWLFLKLYLLLCQLRHRQLQQELLHRRSIRIIETCPILVCVCGATLQTFFVTRLILATLVCCMHALLHLTLKLICQCSPPSGCTCDPAVFICCPCRSASAQLFHCSSRSPLPLIVVGTSGRLPKPGRGGSALRQHQPRF